MATSLDAPVKTRILIVSDTHGANFEPSEKPLHYADVAIHCGDLTNGSKLDEYRSALHLLREINAPLKLVIAGNHDFTMDPEAFAKKLEEAGPLDPDLVEQEYGSPEAVRSLFDDMKEEGIIFLDEGTHHFVLGDGAQLKIFASPYTPSMGAWGFQYSPNKGRSFNIEDGTDIAITHGPPKGIMDYTNGRERAGCSDLFEAIANARPKIHCFGHIHEGWGARLVSWKDYFGDKPSHFTAIDNANSFTVEKLASLAPSRWDSVEEAQEKLNKKTSYKEQRACSTSHCTGDPRPIYPGRHSLFVNASIEGNEEKQLPWLVDIELPAYKNSDVEMT